MNKADFLLFSTICVLSVNAQQGAQLNSLSITVHTEKKIHVIHPHFWGTNFLYWIDDDSALANGKIVAQLGFPQIGWVVKWENLKPMI